MKVKKILVVVVAVIMLCNNYSSYKIISTKASELMTIENIEGEVASDLDLQEENEGFILSEDIDLESNDEISVIVEFKEEPKKVQEDDDITTLFQLFPAIIDGKIEEEHEIMEEHLTEMFYAEGLEDESNDIVSEYIEESYTEIFNGMTINLPANRVEDLLEVDVVKAVYSNDVVAINPIESLNTSNTINMQTLNSDELGVDNLHEEGITGEGVKVAILDTGIDYNHPDLKDVYAGGYDFVDNDSDPMETTYNDWLESSKPKKNSSGNSYYTQHGTHIAGIIAGQGVAESDLTVKGIAPDVEIYAYRVLGPYGSGYTSDILAGIEKAIKDDVDIINLSLGAEVNNHLYPTSIAVNNAVLSGVSVVVSSGNSGPGAYTVCSPGTASLAITVGASTTDVDIEIAKGALINDLDEKYDLKLVARNVDEYASILNDAELYVVDVGSGAELEYHEKDVEGKVVIIERGMDTLHNLILRAKENGAAAVIIHNNNEEETHIPHYIGGNSLYIPSFSISKFEGDLLKLNLNDESKIKLMEFGFIQEGGNTLSDFSSQGPVRDSYDIKPEIVAPGENINSTIPWFMDGPEDEGDYTYAYKELEGTSMASPYVAGVVALMLQNDNTLEPMEIKSKLMNTSDELDEVYSVYEVGAGRINPYNAVKSNINISVLGSVIIDEEVTMDIYDGDLNFGLITSKEYDDFEDVRNIIVSNDSEEIKYFNIDIIQNSSVSEARDWDLNGVRVNVVEDIIVNKNEEIDFDIAINVPFDAEVGCYEGYIILTNKENIYEEYRVPFVINKIEQGTRSLYLDSSVIATPIGYDSDYIVDSTNIYLLFNSSIEDIRLEVIEESTDNIIGILRQIDEEYIIANEEYIIQGFDGSYLPLISENKYGNEFEKLNTGSYKLRLVAIDSLGESIIREVEFYVDNKIPEIKELKLITENGEIAIEDKAVIYEFDPNKEQYINISGELYDDDLEKIINAGINPFEREGFDNYYNLSVVGGAINYDVNENGELLGEIVDISDSSITQLQLQAIDSAGNTSINDIKYINLVKEGTEYISLVPEKIEYSVEEDVVIKLNINNAVDLKELSFNYKIDRLGVSIEEFNLLQKYEDKATIEYDIITDEYGYENVLGKIVFNEPLNTNGEVFEIVEIILKNNNQNWYNGRILLTGISEYTNSVDILKNVETLSIAYNNNPESVLSIIRPYFGEGLIYEIDELLKPTLGDDFDYSSLGIDINIEDLEGNKYKVDYDDYTNNFQVELPLENKSYKATANIPGHFTVYSEFNIDRVDQIKISYTSDINFEVAIAGDINNDNVIDIKDAMKIYENYNNSENLESTSNGYIEGDINFDGVIDSKDLDYVLKNYGLQNLSAFKIPEPLFEIEGITIEDIINGIDGGDKKVSKNKLKSLVEEAEAIDGSRYTETSYKDLIIALDLAITILEDDDATENEVANSEGELKEAIISLVELDILYIENNTVESDSEIEIEIEIDVYESYINIDNNVEDENIYDNKIIENNQSNISEIIVKKQSIIFITIIIFMFIAIIKSVKRYHINK